MTHLPTRSTPRATPEGLLSAKLAALDLPDEGADVVDADSLLVAIVRACDNEGHYYAELALLRRVCWWQDELLDHPEWVETWRDELIARGDLTLTPRGALNCYGGWHDVIRVQNRKRFTRWARRQPIPGNVREYIYRRDGYRCVTCASTSDLTLDHIYPHSLGGSDEPANLQTMCRSCNCRKGARVE